MSIIKEAIGCARVGVPVVHEKMTMYPLYPLSDDGSMDPDYIILDEALASGRRTCGGDFGSRQRAGTEVRQRVR